MKEYSLKADAKGLARIRAARGTMMIALLCATLALPGCSWFRKGGKEEKKVAENPSDMKPGPATPLPPPPSSPVETPRPVGLEPIPDSDMPKIYFDFDKFNIRADQLPNVEKCLKFLNDHKDTKVLVEGHCDERGTTEYNFGLGERRARAVFEYFKKNGIAPERLQTLSKGEEDPVDQGHAEAAWSKNRRCQFKRIHD